MKWRVKAWKSLKFVRALQTNAFNQTFKPNKKQLHLLPRASIQSDLPLHLRVTNLKDAPEFYFSLIQPSKSAEEVSKIQTNMEIHGFPHLRLGTNLLGTWQPWLCTPAVR